MRSELAVLSRRARLINWAISLCTVCALLICAVIVSLFLGPFLQLDLSALVAWVFIAAMIALCSPARRTCSRTAASSAGRSRSSRRISA